MKWTMRWQAVLTGLVLATGPGAAAADWPDFAEVYGLVRSNLAAGTGIDFNQAAVQGLLGQLKGRVILVSPTNSEAALGPGVSQAQVFDEAYGYLRVSQVSTGLADQIRLRIAALEATNTLNGLVLDLRYADGDQYAEAARVANLFLAEDRLLLEWGDRSARSTAKTNAIHLPVAVLINAQTRGAAEALAGILRQTDVGLSLGSATAGQALLYREFTLKNGQQLRVAATPIRLGNGKTLGWQGVSPDIRVQVDPAEEPVYFMNAFQVVRSGLTVAASGQTHPRGLTNPASQTNPRVNEAELVRRHQEGQPINGSGMAPPEGPRPLAPAKPVVQDPVLARALDLLKGLAVVRPLRRTS